MNIGDMYTYLDQCNHGELLMELYQTGKDAETRSETIRQILTYYFGDEETERYLDYYTTAQICNLLNVCKQRVTQLALKRHWRKIKDGRKNLYLREDVDKLIDERKNDDTRN